VARPLRAERRVLVPAVGIALPAPPSEAAGHGDPLASVVLSLVFILIAGKLGADVATRIRQPPVLRELVCGLVLGNTTLLGFSGLERIKSDPFIDILARIGILLLVFEVGLESLESTVGLKVGASSVFGGVPGCSNTVHPRSSTRPPSPPPPRWSCNNDEDAADTQMEPRRWSRMGVSSCRKDPSAGDAHAHRT
jgi:hypothetical protein